MTATLYLNITFRRETLNSFYDLIIYFKYLLTFQKCKRIICFKLQKIKFNTYFMY